MCHCRYNVENPVPLDTHARLIFENYFEVPYTFAHKNITKIAQDMPYTGIKHDYTLIIMNWLHVQLILL